MEERTHQRASRLLVALLRYLRMDREIQREQVMKEDEEKEEEKEEEEEMKCEMGQEEKE